jgi:hypothetical protein
MFTFSLILESQNYSLLIFILVELGKYLARVVKNSVQQCEGREACTVLHAATLQES